MNLIKKILVAQTAVVALWAMSAQAATDEAIAERLKPVGEVCVQGQECAAAGGGAAAAAGSAARSGEEIYGKFCTACHGSGLLNAPKTGDSAAWSARADAKGGVDGLLKSAISGLNAMPPKGTCSDCSDDELKGAIKHMSGL
ncbi:cytochrome c5 [Stutzerimonas stutzeri TS44]|nr:cytochrome c5 [Stutzerimonas stutzeri TS44]